MTRREIAELIERDGGAVYAFCRQMTGSRDEADDLYQETMLKAMECHERIDDELGNPKSFLMGIAAKTWKSRKRMYARRQRIAPKEYVDDEGIFWELAGGAPSGGGVHIPGAVQACENGNRRAKGKISDSGLSVLFCRIVDRGDRRVVTSSEGYGQEQAAHSQNPNRKENGGTWL